MSFGASAVKAAGELASAMTGLRSVLDGLGIAIVSTSRGVLSDRRARELNVGGELLCTVW